MEAVSIGLFIGLAALTEAIIVAAGAAVASVILTKILEWFDII